MHLNLFNEIKNDLCTLTKGNHKNGTIFNNLITFKE